MLAALLGALSLFVAAPAQAQTPDPVTNLAATPGDGKLTVTWTNPSGAGTGTTEVSVRWREQGTSAWTFSANTLVGSTTSFEITGLTNDRTYEVEVQLNWATIGASGTFSSWASTTGTPLGPPLVSLSANPNRVTEGSSVTVTARLSRALSSNVTIPVTITDNTAESGDHGTLASITINSGETTGTGTITTKQDGDTEDETFTVSLGTLPSSVTAGIRDSVTVTITDQTRILTWSSTLTVKQPVTLHLRGCDSSHGMTGNCDSDALTQDTFAYNGESYRIRRLTSEGSIPPHWQIVLGFDKRVPGGMIEVLCLRVDGYEPLCLRDARDQNKIILTAKRVQVPNLYVFGWQKTPIGWTVGQQVSLRFSDDGSGTIDGASGGGGTPGGSSGSSGPTGALGPPGSSGPPAGGGGGGGGGLPPSGSSDEPPPEDDELSTLCSQEDRKNLERFYETTGGEQWDENENWNSEEPLNQWYGVDTDDEGEVVSLRLSENSLSGDTPEELLSCLSELKELALWGNEEDLSGEVPEELVLAVERAVLRDMAEMLNLNPEWFENYGDPYNFEDWHTGVTTDDDRRVVELVLPGEVPGTLISQLRKLRVITTSSENGGCALSPKDDSSASSLFLLALLVFAVLGRKRARC